MIVRSRSWLRHFVGLEHCFPSLSAHSIAVFARLRDDSRISIVHPSVVRITNLECARSTAFFNLKLGVLSDDERIGANSGGETGSGADKTICGRSPQPSVVAAHESR